MKKIVCMIAAALLFTAMPLQQGFAEISTLAFQESLTGLNRIKPLQNPKLEKAGEMLGRKVIDRQNRIVGQVKDVLIKAEDGQTSSLQVSFDRLRLRESVFLSFNEIKIGKSSNGYQVAFKDSEITDLYPEMLANIETAAGAEGEFLSLKKIIDIPVYNAKREKIGKIQEILFGNNGSQAQAVFLGISTGTIRNFGVAVPFASISFEERNGRMVASLQQDQTDLLMAYIKDRS